MGMLSRLDDRDLERLVRDFLAPGIRLILREEMEAANVDRRAVNRLDGRVGRVEADAGRLEGRIRGLEEIVKGKAGAEIVRILLTPKEGAR